MNKLANTIANIFEKKKWGPKWQQAFLRRKEQRRLEHYGNRFSSCGWRRRGVSCAHCHSNTTRTGYMGASSLPLRRDSGRRFWTPLPSPLTGMTDHTTIKTIEEIGFGGVRYRKIQWGVDLLGEQKEGFRGFNPVRS